MREYPRGRHTEPDGPNLNNQKYSNVIEFTEARTIFKLDYTW